MFREALKIQLFETILQAPSIEERDMSWILKNEYFEK